MRSIQLAVGASMIRQALGAFTFAWAAAAAHAAPVEVVLDFTATSRTMHEWFDGDHHYMTDPDFEPVSFSVSFTFDTAGVIVQNMFPGTDAQPAYAFSRFVGGTGAPALTPLYPMLHVPAPGNSTVHGGSDALYGKDLQSVGADRDDAVAVKEHAKLFSYEGWSMPDPSAPGAIMNYEHWQSFAFMRDGAPLSANQLGVLSGVDMADFLRGQIGVLQVGAFSTGGRILSEQHVDGLPVSLLADRGVEYKGDVTIRSVSAVPEPEGLALGLAGMAVVALGLRAKRGQVAQLDMPHQ